VHFKKIVFVGPQGAGKSTQALLLKLWLQKAYNVNVEIRKFIHYTILYKTLLHMFIKIAKLFGRVELIKFYRDEPPVLLPAGGLFRAFFPLFVCTYTIALAVDSTLFKIHREAFVEDEGFIFKQIADLYYLARKFGVLSSKSFRLFMRLALGLIHRLRLKVIIFQMENYIVLVNRYEKQRATVIWRKIEPLDYVILQQAVYRVIAKGCIVDASRDLREVFLDVVKCLLLQL